MSSDLRLESILLSCCWGVGGGHKTPNNMPQSWLSLPSQRVPEPSGRCFVSQLRSQGTSRGPSVSDLQMGAWKSGTCSGCRDRSSREDAHDHISGVIKNNTCVDNNPRLRLPLQPFCALTNSSCVSLHIFSFRSPPPPPPICPLPHPEAAFCFVFLPSSRSQTPILRPPSRVLPRTLRFG